MSGVVEITDGAGTVIEDGEVETNKIITNNIQGKAPSNAITLYTETTGNVDLRTFRFGNNTITTTQLATLPVNLFTNQTGAGNIVLGNSLSRVWASSFRFRDNLMTVETPTTLVNLFTTQSGTGSITIGNSAVKVRTSGCIFENDTLNLLTPANTASLFTTQTASINIGNASISTNVGNFRFTNDILTSSSTGLITLFPDNLGSIVIGNIYKLVQVSRFIFSNSTIFLPSLTGLIELFVNHVENIILGNRFININIGSFNFSNKKITTTTPTELLTLFDTQSGGLTMGNASGPFTLNSSTTAINATTATITSPTTAINATTSTTITSPTTAINATTSTTITSPLTNIVATTKVDITTPNLNVKSNTVIGTNPNYLEVMTAGDEAVRLDFHSNSLYSTDFDSRIASLGGTSSTSGGTLNLASGTINFNNATTVNSNTPSFNLLYGGNSLELRAGSNTAYIDFHSNSSFSTDYDSRIISTGGSALNGGGALYLNANATGGSINIDTPTLRISNNIFRYVPPTTYTCNLNSGTCQNQTSNYTVMGGMMTISVTFWNTTGGTAGTSNIYSYSIPTDFTIKSTAFGGVPSGGQVLRLDAGAGNNNPTGTAIGSGYLMRRGVSLGTVCVMPFDTGSVSVFLSQETNNQCSYQSWYYYPWSLGNLYVSFTATFPIN